MIKKFLSKYILEVVPSIVATVIGAYIVTHYINSKPDADKPKAEIAAPVSPVKEKAKAAKAEPGNSDDAVTGKAAKSEPGAEKKNSATETADAPAAPRRHQPMLRDKSSAKAAPAPAAAPPAETAAKPDETRDANEIARAAIERLRGAESRVQETVKQEPARTERAKVNPVVYAPPVQQQPSPAQPQPTVQALPPAVNVAPAPNETTVGVAPAPFPVPISGQSAARIDDPSRPTPPADIPSRPLDLRTKNRTSVAEDVVSTAKSVFHAVIPDTN